VLSVDWKWRGENDGRAWNRRTKNSLLTEISLQWSVFLLCFYLLCLSLFSCVLASILKRMWMSEWMNAFLAVIIFMHTALYTPCVSSNRIQRSNAKSTQFIQPQTFAASELVSYPSFISCNSNFISHFHVRDFQRPPHKRNYWGDSARCGFKSTTPNTINSHGSKTSWGSYPVRTRAPTVTGST